MCLRNEPCDLKINFALYLAVIPVLRTIKSCAEDE